MPAVILSFDVLPLSLLGCYGGTTVQTPTWDRLATRSVLFDQHYASDVSGHRPAWEADPDCQPAELWRDPSLSVQLISETDSFPVACGGITLEPVARPGPAGSDLPLAQLIQTGCQLLRETPAAELSSRLLWLHSAGFSEANFAEPGESPELAPQPGEPQDGMERAAGYVASADFWLGELLQVLEECCAEKELLFILSAARSESTPLRTLPRDTRIQRTGLTEEIVHTPLLIWSPGLLAGRRQELVQTSDLLPTLAEWFKRPWTGAGLSLWPLLRDEAGTGRQAIQLGNADFQAVRTPTDYLILPRRESRPDLLELGDAGVYIVKPQDVWDVHNRIAEFPERAERLLDQVYPRKESTSGCSGHDS